jgi:hypothetical protein
VKVGTSKIRLIDIVCSTSGALATGTLQEELKKERISLRYKQEGRGFESFRPHNSPGVVSASHKNEYQEYLLGRG